MSTMPFEYDPKAHEGRNTYEPLPPGWYTVTITTAEWRENKSSTGGHLFLELKVDEAQHPEFKGRPVFDRLNLDNPNDAAVEIAQNSLADICDAIGQHGKFSDPAILCHKPLQAKIIVREATGGYDASNEVRDYRGVQNISAASPSPPPRREEKKEEPDAQNGAPF
jgi:hypothetical protein